jgi:hypothetical protein
VKCFGGYVSCDFEYEIAEGGLPNVLCMVAYVFDQYFNHVRTIRLWRGEFGPRPPFDTSPDSLFIAYSAWAELTCFLMLGWKFPARVFDLHTAYLMVSNVLRPLDYDAKKKQQRKRLPDACRYYGIEGWEHVDKDSIAREIGEGRWQHYGQPTVFDYCEEDVRLSWLLFLAMLQGFSKVDIWRIIEWSNYSAKAIARIQAAGMPIDVELWNLVQENKLVVIDALRRRFDPSYHDADPIYDAGGHMEYERLERWAIRNGITAWPRTKTGRLKIDDDAFKLMRHYPGIIGLHAMRDALRVIVTAKLPIGPDGRNRPSLHPFNAATGRNAHAKSLFNAHAGLRGFMRFPPDVIGLYVDWRAQEIGIAAGLSRDQKLIEDYLSGDPYYALAKIAGYAHGLDQKRWKEEKADDRNRMKSLALAVNYGMSDASLAIGLGVKHIIAAGIRENHQLTYPRFWQWREEMAATAMHKRQIVSPYGWPLHLSTSPNPRTLYNFPLQSGGADMLRDSTVKLCDAGIVPRMLVHDGILFEVKNDDEANQAVAIMRTAGKRVCNLDIGAAEDQRLEHGARFQDKRKEAKDMWATIMQALREVGAL